VRRTFLADVAQCKSKRRYGGGPSDAFELVHAESYPACIQISCIDWVRPSASTGSNSVLRGVKPDNVRRLNELNEEFNIGRKRFLWQWPYRDESVAGRTLHGAPLDTHSPRRIDLKDALPLAVPSESARPS